MRYSPFASVLVVNCSPPHPPTNRLKVSQSRTSTPAAGCPLKKALPCTLPLPGAGFSFSTPVPEAMVPSESVLTTGGLAVFAAPAPAFAVLVPAAAFEFASPEGLQAPATSAASDRQQ